MHTFKQKMNSGKYKVHMDTLSSTKWTNSIAGVWTPSPYWSNPKPIGTYYLPVIAILTPAIVLLTLGARNLETISPAGNSAGKFYSCYWGDVSG